jgi:hypothetical protein
MIRHDGTPMYRAARTNSRSRSDRVIPRTIRAEIIHAKAANSTTKTSHVLPRNDGDRIAMIRKEGSTSSRSTTHIRTRSTHPPKYPAVAPTTAARPVEMSPTSSPIVSDFCRPLKVWANTSSPICVVPNQCSVDGGSR